MNLSMKQSHRHREKTSGCQGGGGWERDGVGGRMDKQPGPTVRHRELYSISCDKP